MKKYLEALKRRQKSDDKNKPLSSGFKPRNEENSSSEEEESVYQQPDSPNFQRRAEKRTYEEYIERSSNSSTPDNDENTSSEDINSSIGKDGEEIKNMTLSISGITCSEGENFDGDITSDNPNFIPIEAIKNPDLQYVLGKASVNVPTILVRKLLRKKFLELLHAQQCVLQERKYEEECQFDGCKLGIDNLCHLKMCNPSEYCSNLICGALRRIIRHWKNCSQYECLFCYPIKTRGNNIYHQNNRQFDDIETEDLYIDNVPCASQRFFEQLIQDEFELKKVKVETRSTGTQSIEMEPPKEETSLTLTEVEEMRSVLNALYHTHRCYLKQLNSLPRKIQCSMPQCIKIRNTLDHMEMCLSGDECDKPLCILTWKVVMHWRSCFVRNCKMCISSKRAEGICFRHSGFLYRNADIASEYELDQDYFGGPNLKKRVDPYDLKKPFSNMSAAKKMAANYPELFGEPKPPVRDVKSKSGKYFLLTQCIVPPRRDLFNQMQRVPPTKDSATQSFGSEIEMAYTRENVQKQIHQHFILLQHVQHCKISPYQCHFPHCSRMRDVLEHVKDCGVKTTCNDRLCRVSKMMLDHCSKCSGTKCLICAIFEKM